MRFLLLLAAFPALGAVAMVMAAVRSRLTEPELRRTGEPAVATIVDSRRETLDDGRVAYRPVLTFATQRGRSVRAVGDTSSPRPFLTDKSVTVVYDPRKPQTVLVGPSRSRTYLVGAVVFGAIAVIMVGVALIVR
ncbi:MAG: DUF3592 domain-containing protein [Kineosporiaceae bacterium]